MDPTGAPVFSPRKEATAMLKAIILAALTLLIIMVSVAMETYHGDP